MATEDKLSLDKSVEARQQLLGPVTAFTGEKPSFNYDLDLFNHCKEFLDTKNHHGLALIARQKGIPPFLRFKIWPILLKYHPYVVNPFIQPDRVIINSDKDDSKEKSQANSDAEIADDIRAKIKKDLTKYIQRLKYSSNIATPTALEWEIFETLENAVLRFVTKWGRIIKYDSYLTWFALNLAEWFPPIEGTPWVLVGRDNPSMSSSFTLNFMDEYSNYIDNVPNLKEYLQNLVSDSLFVNMSFSHVYERLVLVLLHSPLEKVKKRQESQSSGHSSDTSSSNSYSGEERNPHQVNRTILPVTGGTIEERVSFFISSLRKVLPELLNYFHEEHILNKFGAHDDEWLIWWLNYCGSKVWSKYDRGRIWDVLFGWRVRNPKKDQHYYFEKLKLSPKFIAKLGPDNFWSLDNEDQSGFDHGNSERRNSFRELVNELNDKNDKEEKLTDDSSHGSDLDVDIPFCKVDAHIELVFISLALLKSQENVLVELDQHEIRQYLLRLPTKSYNYKLQKRKAERQGQGQGSLEASDETSTSVSIANSELSSTSSSLVTTPSIIAEGSDLDTCCTPKPPHEDHDDVIISNDSVDIHKVDFMDNILNEAGELWRKWLWLEMIDDN